MLVVLAVAVEGLAGCGAGDGPGAGIAGQAGGSGGGAGASAGSTGGNPVGGAPGSGGAGTSRGGTTGSGGTAVAGSGGAIGRTAGGAAGDGGGAGGSGGDAPGGSAGAGAGGTTGPGGRGGGTAGVTAGTGGGGGGRAGTGGDGGAGAGGTGGVAGAGGAVTFDPADAVTSVALSVTTTGATKMLTLRNGLGAPINLSSLTMSGSDAARFMVDGPATLPTIVGAGSALNLTVRFLPPTNSSTSTYSATFTATFSSGGGTGMARAGLYGLAMNTSNSEPTLDQVVRTLGFAINVGGTTITLGTGSAAIGDEILLRRFIKAPGAAQVRVEPVARYAPFEAADYGYYTGSAPSVTRHVLGTMSRGPMDNVANRTLFPPVDAGATLTFDPGTESFGIFAESGMNAPSLGSDARFYQEDALNNDQAGVLPVHRFRVYPLKNRAGQAVANSFLLVCEEASNSDYQDYVFLIANVTPAPN